MSDAVKIGFVPFSCRAAGVLVLFTDESLKFGRGVGKTLGPAADIVKRAAETSRFKGKSGSSLDILAPAGLKVDRLIVAGTGKARRPEGEGFHQDSAAPRRRQLNADIDARHHRRRTCPVAP